MSTLTLVLTAVGSVLLLLFLVMKARMHAFVALMVVSIGAGLFSGMPLDKIAATMEKDVLVVDIDQSLEGVVASTIEVINKRQ